MKSYLFKAKQNWTGLCLAVAGFTGLIAANDPVSAAKVRNEQFVESRPADEPIMAIISLYDQQITVYDDKGWILRAPVSSGQKGRETPAGIFSVIQKEAEHYSNMYDDAYMPHMQRLTWSGIALHGGPLPGNAASHGCIRMPYDFAAPANSGSPVSPLNASIGCRLRHRQSTRSDWNAAALIAIQRNVHSIAD
jgi:hypothetical protein